MGPGSNFAKLSVLCGLGWALVLVIAVQPTPHSLAYAGAVLFATALAAWALEARERDGEDTPAFSIWPAALALAVTAVTAGVVVRWELGGLLIALPYALLSTRVWFVAAVGEAALGAGASAGTATDRELAVRAASGDAIAIERSAGRSISRRGVLRAGLWLGLGAGVLAAFGSMLDYLWERKPEAFGGLVVVGPPEKYPPGSKTRIREGRFWLVNLTAAQGGPGFLALWQKCPHLGCTVPWEQGYSFTDPRTGTTTKGWFLCPCHGSTYNEAGVRVDGPAPRSMDRMELKVNAASGLIEVDTGRVTKGAPNNATHAVKT